MLIFLASCSGDLHGQLEDLLLIFYKVSSFLKKTSTFKGHTASSLRDCVCRVRKRFNENFANAKIAPTQTLLQALSRDLGWS